MKRYVLYGVLAGMVALMCPQARQAEEKKDSGTATLWGWLLGFGAGHYYANDHRAPYITAGEVAGWGMLLGGASGDSEGLAIAGFAGLFGLRLYEIIDAGQAAKRYNKRHATQVSALPFDLGIGGALTPAYGNSARMSALWAEGGGSRDLALAMSAAQSQAKPVRFDLDVQNLGVGFSMQGNF